MHLFLLTSFLCSLAVKSQLSVLPHFSIWSDIVVEKYKCLLAPLQVFVSQLKMSHGSVPKSGLKLLQMFSNDRLQCQHQPTSTFVYYIFLFDVAQTNLSVRRTRSGLRRNPQVGDFYFVDQEKLSECGFVCQREAASASYTPCCNKAVLKTVAFALRTHASGENMTIKSEQILWSLLVRLRIFPMNSFIVISTQAGSRLSWGDVYYSEARPAVMKSLWFTDWWPIHNSYYSL